MLCIISSFFKVGVPCVLTLYSLLMRDPSHCWMNRDDILTFSTNHKK